MTLFSLYAPPKIKKFNLNRLQRRVLVSSSRVPIRPAWPSDTITPPVEPRQELAPRGAAAGSETQVEWEMHRDTMGTGQVRFLVTGHGEGMHRAETTNKRAIKRNLSFFSLLLQNSTNAVQGRVHSVYCACLTISGSSELD